MLTDLGVVTDAGEIRRLTQGWRVRQLQFSTGRIDAEVHHRELGSCTVAIEVAGLSEAQWEAALDALSSQAIFAAQLLAGEMPKEIESVFVKAGADLIPIDATELGSSCSCCDGSPGACGPVLAAYTAVADMLNDDPWLMLRLRGRDRQQVLHGLNAKRNQVVGAASPHSAASEQSLVYRAGGSPSQLDESAMLDAEIDHFWGRSRAQLQFQHHITPPLIELVLLRRLGPPHFADDSFDVYDNLSAVYRTVTDSSLALAFSTEDDALLDETDSAA